MLSLTGILIAIFLVILAAYSWHIRQAYNFFKKINIPGPSPLFLFGNFLEILKIGRLSIAISQWTDRYGRIFGYFEGHTPILVVSDPDVLQDIFISSFSNFHSRRTIILRERDSKDVSLIRAIGLRWKRQRFVINPLFSSMKLKQMTPLVHRTVGLLMKKLSEEAKTGQSFDIYAYYKRFTMDTIWSCAFGIDTDMQNNTNDPYLINSQNVFEKNKCAKLLELLSLLISEMYNLWARISRIVNSIGYRIGYYFPFTKKFIQENSDKWIIRHAYEILQNRKQTNQTDRMDLIQLMLESATDEEFINDEQPSTSEKDENGIEPSLIRKLTIPEIASNIYLFMIAGYETTSTALAYVSYILATHSIEQQKLQEHIDAYFNPKNEDEMPSYDTIARMDYLDMFIRETLRMYPITPVVVNRQSTEEFYIKNIGTIPAGTRFAVDMYRIHFDPDLWGPVDPNIFHPERFETKRHPMAWIPFGAGPRNCIGMHFALMEMKIVLVRLLKTYSIIGCDDEIRKSFENLNEYIVIAPNKVTIRLQHRI